MSLVDREPIAISALQHLLFCRRQFALIHLEQVWAENRFTAEGQVMHGKAHDGPDEARPGIKIVRGLPVSSESHGISGVCDVVELHYSNANRTRLERVIPVEYKRGKPKSHQADEVQLCAQAMCLEGMMQVSIPFGYLFYGKPRRRTEVAFDEALRSLVDQCVADAVFLFQEGKTPAPVFEKHKCESCSLIELCRPRINERKRGVQAWFNQVIEHP